MVGCTHTFFQPERALIQTPERAGLRYEIVRLRAADGVELFTWFLPARGTPKATVLFLHGNAENISTHFMNVAWMPAEGFNVLALEYRGYGSSDGTPSLAGVQLDIDAALETLLERPDVERQRIVLFGQSLGGALAIHYAARGKQRNALRAVIADSAFADYRAIVKEKLAGFFFTWPFQWLPVLTVDNDYSPLASVRAVSPLPLLLIHGESDAIVPAHHSKRLYEAAAQPKELWLLPTAGHIQSVRDPALRRRLSEFVLRAVQ
ncbi:MAG TPA: alpha/beta fold hydrolase [Burkholderiales bacterium]|nr:alpha/beta fold hydrolase [Burkholderiales bacterium]